MNINAITPSFKGNVKFSLEVKRCKGSTKKTIEIPPEKIVSYLEVKKTKEYPGGRRPHTEITTQITDTAGEKYKFSLSLEQVKEKIEQAKKGPAETFIIPNVNEHMV